MRALGAMGVGLLGLLAMLDACSQSDATHETGAVLFDFCRIDDKPCASGLACSNQQCTKSCASASDCGEDGACGVAASGEPICTPRCSDALDKRVTDSICIDGAYRHCDSTPCAVGLACVPGLGCVQPTGGPCATDWDCVSRNCGVGGICKVADGAECTKDDCDFCATLAGVKGRTFCIKPCESRFDCVSGVCERNQGNLVCRPSCLPECSCVELAPMSAADPYQSYCTNELLPIP